MSCFFARKASPSDPELGSRHDPKEDSMEDSISNGPYDERHWIAGAKFMNQDPDGDLWIFRRFGKLRIFNILCIQERLAQLESDYERKEKAVETVDKKLPADIQRTLEEYDNALSALAKLRSYQRPQSHILDHMANWSSGKSSALFLRMGFVPAGGSQYNDDLASIAAVEKSWIHRFIDKHRWLRWRFERKDQNYDDKSTLIYYESKVRRAETFLIHGSFWFLLFCPVIVLSYLPDIKLWKLLFVAFFLLGASVLSASLLNAPNTSGLALVAGYAAILVVFVNTNNGNAD